MEDQIVSAIQIAWEPTAPQAQKPAAFEYVNRLRQEPQAWEPCINIFTRLPRHIEVARIFSLEIVNNAIQAGLLDQAGLDLVKNRLLQYLRSEYAYATNDVHKPPPDSSAIENKIAQTITYLFCSLYPTTWTTFFDDLLSLTTTGSGQRDSLIGVAFYLRVVNSVHDEVGDVLVAKSKEEQEKANALKDLLRARDVARIAQSWQEILSHWQTRSGVIGELTMSAIGKWVSWIDIGLVVNQNMLQLMSQQVQQNRVQGLEDAEELARDKALAAFTEIVSKKMPSVDKINMIEFIGLQDMIEKLGAWPILNNQKSSDYDVDLAEEVAKLVAVALQDIMRVLDTEQQSSGVWRKAEQMLRAFLPQLLRYFSDQYDEVCSHVLPAMTDVLAYFRKAFQGDEYMSQRASVLVPILQAIFVKSRIEDYNDNDGEYDGDNTEEAEFLELRKRLSTLQQSIAATDEQLYMDAVSAMINDTFEKFQRPGQNVDWRDLDLALHEMYLMGDLAVRNGGLYQKAKPNSPAAERLIRMMLVMVQSSIGSTRTPALQVQYMEICNRYSMFFEKHSQYVQPVLQNFLNNAHSPNTR
ncbi:pre-tRNA nuclear export protein, partial [Elasticomyces elasticus]